MQDLEIFFSVIGQLLSFNLSGIEKREWEIFQGYGFFSLVVFLVVILYAYWFHLYRSEKRGERNYEKYADLALNDELDDRILENKRSA
ncbi:cytochrome c oxidase, cbb3-type, CcoQ subunit [Campylobacter upsaliensis]|uniref:Cytochrome c oxidase, cbb3-type, subunit IV n=1 Tax=Campylobacter upsaliensis TaxID=28080 RepID=A0A381EKH3_CAMUP|nr:cytochrome c oxidase, cbb3-type, CcoQ subunit [Campylobacter upsaliensis]EAL53638.1 cbb3-type cytochrome c oxidase subunit Q (CcoQ)-related protein [Campylobacter upsaliensis RM3195]MCR2100048.1 cytochrome c oxidase, cbb3-type, CcoQ subunit [Campylobacter upsaliensis]MCR2102115.1 cytochrome c oxidase, cbb3-type, CcoQ subunit [Campylobacter upsaliensis]MCR2107596.1 cytochrome c oxidase, cbb3-type, CcoQ subunit [Campylobacter upsaliensis]MCR2109677.1 cytochrome c oxidase, cbb3-type, CcoQ subu